MGWCVRLLADIDRTLSGFLRGQALVCLCLGLIYGIGLTLVGLNYGATVGIVAGFLSFIPYVGSTFGLVVSVLLAVIQFDMDAHRHDVGRVSCGPDIGRLCADAQAGR